MMSNGAPDAEVLVEEGLALYSQGQLDRALSCWREALLLEPGLALALEYIKYVEENRVALEATFSPEPSASEPKPKAAEPEREPGEPTESTSATQRPFGFQTGPTPALDESAFAGPAKQRPTVRPFGFQTGPTPTLDEEFLIDAESPSPVEEAPVNVEPAAHDDFLQEDKSLEIQVAALEEVRWDDLMDPEEERDPDLTPRIDVDALTAVEAGNAAPESAPSPGAPPAPLDDQTRRHEALSKPALRDRHATPLTLGERGTPAPKEDFSPQEDLAGLDAAFAPYESDIPTGPPVPRASLVPTAEVAVAGNTLDRSPSPEVSFADVGSSELADAETPGRAMSTGPERPTIKLLSDSDKRSGLQPEAMMSVSEEDLVAEEATPASMIRRTASPSVPGARSAPPPIPGGAPVAVPPPVPRTAVPRSAPDKKLQLSADEGFIGLDDLLTSDEEAAHQAPPRSRTPAIERAHSGSQPAASGSGSHPESGSQPRASRPGGGTGPALDGHAPQSSSAPGARESGLEGLARAAAAYGEPVAQPPPPADAEERAESMFAGAQQLFDQGTFEGSLWLCEKILSIEPENAEGADLLQRNQEVLLGQYERTLGDMTLVPMVQIPPQEIVWHKLDHRAGFLLSRVDGMLCYDDILDISGMGRFEACRILAQLVEQGVIGCPTGSNR